jgi:hypothetical protein
MTMCQFITEKQRAELINLNSKYFSNKKMSDKELKKYDDLRSINEEWSADSLEVNPLIRNRF